MKKLLIIVLLVYAFSSSSQTMKPNYGFGREMAEIMHNMKEYTLEIAQLMPADKYDFRPSVDKTVRSFAEQLKHLIFSNNHQAENLLEGRQFDLAQLIQSMKAYEEIKMSKQEIIDGISSSYDKIIKRFEEMSEDDFNRLYRAPFIKQPKSLRVMSMFVRDHNTHHRAQLVVYLRMNNIVPATYRPF